MDQTLLILMIVVAGVSAIALCIQAGMLFGIWKASKATQDRIVIMIPKVEKFLETSQEAIEQSKKQILEITTKTNLILDSTRSQLAKVDELLTDASSRAKFQMDRAELVLDDAMSRAQETVAVVQSGVLRPLREIQGVAAGLRPG